MSSHISSIEFTYVVADPDHWDAESRAAAREDPDAQLCSDWVSRRMREVMRAAGERFMAEHPDVFASDLL